MYAIVEKWKHYLDSELTTFRYCKLCRGLVILTARNLVTDRCIILFHKFLIL